MTAPDAPLDPDALAPALKILLAKAKHYGADAADAIATHGRSLSIVVREAELEDVDNSEGRDVGLRVIIGGRQACVSSSDVSERSLDALAERAVAMARLAPEDPYCGLAPEELLQKDPMDFQVFDPCMQSPEALKAKALEIEKAALSVKGVSQAESASASWSTSAVQFMTSAGFNGGWLSSRHDLAGMAIVSDDGNMERDMAYHGTRWLEDLKTPEEIGRKAGERAVARLRAAQLPSGEMPVLFDKRVAGGLIGSLLGAINGAAVARGISFLKDMMGEQIFAPGIDIIDDPHMLRGHGSRPWDGEGVRTQPLKLIDNGRLTTWLLNTPAAKQLGLETTGHASRGIGSPPSISSSNTYMAAGGLSPEDLMKKMEKGLLISEMFGPSFNQNTGDYSVGVAGFAIENGERAGAVSEVTIAGNLKDMFSTLIPANDLEFNGSVSAPSILIESLTLAGE